MKAKDELVQEAFDLLAEKLSEISEAIEAGDANVGTLDVVADIVYGLDWRLDNCRLKIIESEGGAA